MGGEEGRSDERKGVREEGGAEGRGEEKKGMREEGGEEGRGEEKKGEERGGGKGRGDVTIRDERGIMGEHACNRQRSRREGRKVERAREGRIGGENARHATSVLTTELFLTWSLKTSDSTRM
eukprot:758827-Hanusia_phi.AAC.5